MKLPKTFRPKKNLDGKIKQFLKESELRSSSSYDPYKMSILLDSCDSFLQRIDDSQCIQDSNTTCYFRDVYKIGKSLSKEMKEIGYTKNYLKMVIPQIAKIEEYHKHFLGWYLSGLINQIIRNDDVIELELDTELFGLGACLKKGELILNGVINQNIGRWMEGGRIKIKEKKPVSYQIHFVGAYMKEGLIIIEGDANDFTGTNMEGGKIIVEGDAGCCTGHSMIGGEIIIEGNIQAAIGEYAKGGVIRVYGEIEERIEGEGISPSCKATIYQGHKKVWPK